MSVHLISTLTKVRAAVVVMNIQHALITNTSMNHHANATAVMSRNA